MKKKILSILFSFIIGLGLSNEVDASVGTVSVTVYKTGNSVNAYVKNNNNKYSKNVKLELQKNGSTISTQRVTVNKNKQIKKVFKLNSKGKYRIKYTVDGKHSYTSTFYY